MKTVTLPVLIGNRFDFYQLRRGAPATLCAREAQGS